MGLAAKNVGPSPVRSFENSTCRCWPSFLYITLPPGLRVLSREFGEELGGCLIIEASQTGAIVIGDEAVEVGVTFGVVDKAAVISWRLDQK